jgi:hypothetical protein
MRTEKRLRDLQKEIGILLASLTEAQQTGDRILQAASDDDLNGAWQPFTFERGMDRLADARTNLDETRREIATRLAAFD